MVTSHRLLINFWYPTILFHSLALLLEKHFEKSMKQSCCNEKTCRRTGKVIFNFTPALCVAFVIHTAVEFTMVHVLHISDYGAGESLRYMAFMVAVLSSMNSLGLYLALGLFFSTAFLTYGLSIGIWYESSPPRIIFLAMSLSLLVVFISTQRLVEETSVSSSPSSSSSTSSTTTSSFKKNGGGM